MKNTLFFLLLVLFFTSCKNEQPADNYKLPRSTPEAEGVDSEGIINFLNAVIEKKNELHSFMVLRHGKVIAEGWVEPFADTLNHTLYSVTKTFTSTGIGFAVSEGLLSVDDKVISFFPDMLPDTISPYLESLAVKDLLIMAAGQEKEPMFSMSDSSSVKTFLAVPFTHQPGTRFMYNSYASHILSAIVQKVSGQNLEDYLQSRLFEPLGIKNIVWQKDAGGISIGGWGLSVKTEDMAKLGQFYLQKGMWEGKQLLPEWWIDEATKKRIEQEPDWTPEKRLGSDWAMGYCYQIWRCKRGAYRADGAYGQYIVVMPEQDMVVVTTAQSDNLGFIWTHILPTVQDNPLPPNPEKEKQLQEKINSLTNLPSSELLTSPIEKVIANKTYEFADSSAYIKNVKLEFDQDTCKLVITYFDNDQYHFKFGRSFWIPFSLKYDENNSAEYVGSFNWKDENTLYVKMISLEGYSQDFTFKFDSDKITMSNKHFSVEGKMAD